MLLPTNREMALLFIKNAVLGRNRHAGYAPLGSGSTTSSPVIDAERGSASNSNDSFSIDNEREKRGEVSAATESAPFRINPRIISDATIGLSDGLTVPFALTAGLSALGDTKVVIYGGLAELIAGGISMGLGGYLGAKSEAEAYVAAVAETRAAVANVSGGGAAADREAQASRMVAETFEKYDFPPEVVESMARSLRAQPELMLDFLMQFRHRLAEADFAPSRAYISGLTIALAYFFGGLVPLLPYLFATSVQRAFALSMLVMALALFVFGWAKTALVGEANRWVCCKNGVQMIFLGAIAAGAAMGCVKAIGS